MAFRVDPGQQHKVFHGNIFIFLVAQFRLSRENRAEGNGISHSPRIGCAYGNRRFAFRISGMLPVNIDSLATMSSLWIDRWAPDAFF
jgi:hypothetical protein